MPALTRNNIAVCQVHAKEPGILYDRGLEFGIVRFKRPLRRSVSRRLRTVLSACAKEAFLAILPENSVPIDLLPELRDIANRLNLTIIAGLEHDIAWLPGGGGGREDYLTGAYRVENRLVALRPGKEVIHERKNAPAIVRGHSVVEQIERVVEPEYLLLQVPTPGGGHIRVWAILCSDFLELTSERISSDEMERTIREMDVDLVAVLSHTQRVDPFHSTMERLLVSSGRRALPTNIVFANLAHYGGSMCWAYSDRKALRESAKQKSEFLSMRPMPSREEAHRTFPDWGLAEDEARSARRG